MSAESIVLIAGLVTALAAVLVASKRIMEAVADLMLSVVPVITAIGKIRAAWRESFTSNPPASAPAALEEGGAGSGDNGRDVG
ncbi:hypothetical protein [Streptomyces sp. NPDC052012]|uniref:hypothetical protein n=1 Tax=Streptomyces sp. NPDC052012 TaxID=3155051 RepID=UPI00345052FC